MAFAQIISEKLGDNKIRVDAKTKYICASDLCKAGGKLWKHYNENLQTKTFIEELVRVVGIPATLLIKSSKTGPYLERGTWVHNQVAMHLAY